MPACSSGFAPASGESPLIRGLLTLRGPVLSSEVQDLLSAAAAVRGVRSVINELEPHDSSEGVPALQGRGRLAGPRLDLLQSRWAPATRALVGAAAVAAGGLAIAYRRRWSSFISIHKRC